MDAVGRNTCSPAFPSALTGLQRALGRVDAAAEDIAAGQDDLTGPMVEIIRARQQFGVNLSVLRNSLHMHDSLIDLLA